MFGPRKRPYDGLHKAVGCGKFLFSFPVIIALLVAFLYFGGGDRDPRERLSARIHVYNSTGSKLTVEIKPTSEHGQKQEKEAQRLTLKSGKGYTYRAYRADTYKVQVLEPADKAALSQDVVLPAPDTSGGDVVIDLGARGKLFVLPMVFLPMKWSEEQKRQANEQYAKQYPLETLKTGQARHDLTRVIDYGLHEGSETSISRKTTSKGTSQPIVKFRLTDTNGLTQEMMKGLR